jgi:hypothetical protein
MGYGADVNYVDGLFKADLSRTWDLSPFIFTPGPTIAARAYATFAAPSDSLLLPEQWSNATLGELGGSGSYETALSPDGAYTVVRGTAGGGLASSAGPTPGATPASATSGAYLRGEASVGVVRAISGSESQLRLRVFGGFAHNTPRQRAIFASSQDPFETFDNDLFRPRGALLKQAGVNFLPLGGAGLRGFGIDVPLSAVVAGNGELVQRIAAAKGAWGEGTLALSIFGDAGIASSEQIVLPDALLADVGVGLAVNARLYDRSVDIRLDAPVFVNHGSLAGGRGLGGGGSIAPRWTLSVGELW